jgi:hypothetical protein
MTDPGVALGEATVLSLRRPERLMDRTTVEGNTVVTEDEEKIRKRGEPQKIGKKQNQARNVSTKTSCRSIYDGRTVHEIAFGMVIWSTLLAPLQRL